MFSCCVKEAEERKKVSLLQKVVSLFLSLSNFLCKRAVTPTLIVQRYNFDLIFTNSILNMISSKSFGGISLAVVDFKSFEPSAKSFQVETTEGKAKMGFFNQNGLDKILP